MKFVLFHIKTGSKVAVYDSEQKTREQMRTLNNNSGWTKSATSYVDGVEMEWSKAPKSHTEAYDYAPYGFTEYERWKARFEPKIKANLVISESDDNY